MKVNGVEEVMLANKVFGDAVGLLTTILPPLQLSSRSLTRPILVYISLSLDHTFALLFSLNPSHRHIHIHVFSLCSSQCLLFWLSWCVLRSSRLGPGGSGSQHRVRIMFERRAVSMSRRTWRTEVLFVSSVVSLESKS